MDWLPILYSAILVLTVVFTGVLVQIFRAVGNINKLIKDAHKEILPSLTRLQITIEEVNKDLANVNQIAQSVQEITEKANKTFKLAQEAVSSPLIKAISFSVGARDALDKLLRRKVGR